MRHLRVLALGMVTACGGFGTAPCVDADADGVCDDDTACEADADGDGVCNPDDICPNGPDGVDADADGVPDACDPCPELEGGDSDGDGSCDAVDPCPDDETDSCDVNLFVAVQVDGFHQGSSWVLRDPSGSELDSGSFSGAGAGYITRPTVPATGLSCVTVQDDDGNGGIRGRIFSRQLGVVYAEWDFYDWETRRESFCFDPSTDGTPTDPIPTESEFLAETGFCDVAITFETGAYAEEHAWQLRRSGGDILAGFSGSWTSEAQYTMDDREMTDIQRFTVVPGQYEVVMFDRFDAWNDTVDSAFHAEITVDVEGQSPITDQLLLTECEGVQECTRAIAFTATACN